MKKKECAISDGCRMGKVGGQAVLEGVMMKAGKRTVTTCRKDDGSIVVNDNSFVSVREKHKILNIPILRGVVNFVEMMILSVKTMNASAEALGLEEEEGKFELWLKKHFGLGITTFIMVIGVVLGLALSLFLFMFLPIFAADLINRLVVHLGGAGLGAWQKVIEGVLKVVIFLGYMWIVSFMPDIKRTFMYHGAEHKTIACYEAGDELTPENAMKHSRFHPRCGTSFMFFTILLGIIAGLVIYAFVPYLKTWEYTLIRLGILPLLMGIGYEFIKFAGKHNNFLVKMLSAPGLWVQRLTTKEPTPDMLEIAIVSTKCALRDESEEFMEFFKNRGWDSEADIVKTAPFGRVMELERSENETQVDIIEVEDSDVIADDVSAESLEIENYGVLSEETSADGSSGIEEEAGEIIEEEKSE